MKNIFMNKNRILAMLMICALILTLCACVGETNVTSDELAKSENAASRGKNAIEKTKSPEGKKSVSSSSERGNTPHLKTICAGSEHTIGIKSDGSAVATGENRNGQCEVSGWYDIVAVSAGYLHTVGLRVDGTVVTKGVCKQKVKP